MAKPQLEFCPQNISTTKSTAAAVLLFIYYLNGKPQFEQDSSVAAVIVLQEGHLTRCCAWVLESSDVLEAVALIF